MTTSSWPPRGYAVLVVNLGGDLQESITMPLAARTLRDAHHEILAMQHSHVRHIEKAIDHAVNGPCEDCRRIQALRKASGT